MVAKVNRFEGWQLYWWIATVLLAMCALGLWMTGTGIDGIRLVIRATARSSLILFLAAFAASAAATLWPGAITAWMRRNRRQLGLGFATSHGLHLMAIVALATSAPDLFATLSPPRQVLTGSTAYIVIAAMALTSFNATARAIGAKAWRRLHWWGGWYIALSFIFTNGKRIPVNDVYVLPVALVLAAIALRVIAARRKSVAAPAMA